jgi:CBS domain-containing protein
MRTVPFTKNHQAGTKVMPDSNLMARIGELVFQDTGWWTDRCRESGARLERPVLTVPREDAKGKPMRVERIMTRNPITVAPQDSLRRAIVLMKDGGFRRLPVVEEHQLVGILTDRDIRLITN